MNYNEEEIVNRERRGIIKKALKMLRDAESEIEYALDEENTCIQNMPECFETSDRYCDMEAAAGSLENALECIREAEESLDEVL